MKDLHIGDEGSFIQTANRSTNFVRPRISFRSHHHADARPIVPYGRRNFVQLAVDRCFKQIEQVALQAKQDRLDIRDRRSGTLYSKTLGP